MAALRARLAMLAALAAAILALAACGGGDDDGDSAEPGGGADTQEAPGGGGEPGDGEDGGAEEEGEENEESGSRGTEIEMREFAFAPGRVTVRRGTTIRTPNRGEVAHNLTIEEPGSGRKLAGTPTIDAGQDATIDVRLDPGRYLMVCTVPGHRESGMLGDLVVR